MSKEYIFDIIGNDENNVKMLEETLYEIKNTLFNNMYTAEKSATKIQRYDTTMDNFLTRTPHKCSFSTPIQLITESYRETFKHSKFHGKTISYSDLLENPDIFYLSILIFIDGELYTNANFEFDPEEYLTIISFNLYGSFDNDPPYINPGFTQSEMDQFITSESKLTVFAIPNYRDDYLHTTKNNVVLRTNGETNQGFNVNDFASYNDTITIDNPYHLTFITKDDSKLYKYTGLTSLYHEDIIRFNPSDTSRLTNSYSYIRYMKFRNVLTTVNVAPNVNFFSIAQQSYPVPVENMVIFKNINGDIYFDHDTTINIHYLNYYKVNRSHSYPLIIMVFYKNNTTYGLKHSNELRLYNKFTSNILDKYNNGTIPDYIKNYTAISTNYGMKDYALQDLDPLHYKINSLINIIRKDGDFYKVYLDKLVGSRPQSFIDVSEIPNLSSRLRTDTSIENPDNVVTFDTPCYVFTLYSASNKTHRLITIDNRTYIPTYELNTNKYLYMYIDSSLVNEDTVIYIDTYFDKNIKQTVTSSSTSTYIGLNIADDTLPQDLFFINSGKYMDSTDYELYTKLSDGSYKKLTDDIFYHYDNLYIKVVNSTMLNKPISVHTSRVNKIESHVINSRFSVNTIEGTDYYLDKDINNIRMYKNGQLLPRNGYKVTFDDNAAGPHVFRSLTSIGEDDTFMLAYTPDKRYLVYSQETIHESGVVSVFKKINKPIDLRYHEIYLNGLKLGENEIEIIAPHLFIIKNVNTLRNLQIYQINLDKDASQHIDDDNTDVSDYLYENIEELKSNILSSRDPIPDEMDDLFDDIWEDYISLLEDIVKAFKFINPDQQQITNAIATMYPELLDSDHNYFINPDKIIRSPFSVFIYPDSDDESIIYKSTV